MTFHATIVQKKLEEAGFDAKQAHGLASILETDVVGHLEETLVTRDHFDARLAQFEAKVDTRFAQFEAKVDSRFAQIDSRFAEIETRSERRFGQIEARFGQVDSKFGQIETRFGHMDSRFAQIDSRFVQMDAKFADLKAELLKWMIGLIAGSTITVVLAIMRFAK